MATTSHGSEKKKKKNKQTNEWTKKQTSATTKIHAITGRKESAREN